MLFGIMSLLAGGLPAVSYAQNQQINVFWFQDASCSAWNKSAGNKAIRLQYEFWIRGFVSGHNYGNPALQVAVGAFPGSDTLYEYLDQFCRDQPKSSFIGGAMMLVEQLRQPAAAPAKPAAAKKEAPLQAAPAPAAKP